RRDMRVIALLAIGLVLGTVAGVGVFAHEVIGLPWASSFTLGAILGPTDAIAATAILRRLSVPRRIATILEGEALVNDATALVAYKVAVAVAVGEGFSASHAGLEFLYVAAGGIAIGLVVGYLLAEIRKRLDDPMTEATMSLFSGYAAFLPADQLRLSGVLPTSRRPRSAPPAPPPRSPAASPSAPARPTCGGRSPACRPRPSGKCSLSCST